MRAAARLLASVKSGQTLEAGVPTGLTGLLTHPSPRSTLLFHYTSTLDKLKKIPESSVYRQSTEALTRHRLAILQESKPKGWDEWAQKMGQYVDDDPTRYSVAESEEGFTVVLPNQAEVDERARRAEWDGEKFQQVAEGIRNGKEKAKLVKQLKGAEEYTPERTISQVKFEPEPQYTAEAIADLENKIGAGLIEEVIAVAEGEHKLVGIMTAAQVWEPLSEPAPEGQWSYFERATHTSTQKP